MVRCNDFDVRIEAISVITECMSLFSHSQVERDCIPEVLEALERALDTSNMLEVRVKMTKICGRFLDQLSKLHLDRKYALPFLGFVKKAIDDPKDEVRDAIIYNLPFFYFLYYNDPKEARYFGDLYE